MKKISAKIVADSMDSGGNRITSYILTYPRFIHAEVMTHRMFSRNAASSRAIPFKKMVEAVKEDPFFPIAFQKKHSGMQGSEYIEDKDGVRAARAAWLSGAESAVAAAQAMDMLGITKQLANRLLEPYLWYTVLVTATEYDNFFELRCPEYHNYNYLGAFGITKSRKDAMEQGLADYGMPEHAWRSHNKSQAEIHIQALAESMWDARNESTPKVLEDGEWHIPFGDKIFSEDNIETFLMTQPVQWVSAEGHDEELEKLGIKIATARCARLSYMTFDGEIDYAKDIALHDMLLKSRHMSPFEHVAKCMSKEEYECYTKSYPRDIENADFFSDKEEGWCNNFRGFIPYRYIIENE